MRLPKRQPVGVSDAELAIKMKVVMGATELCERDGLTPEVQACVMAVSDPSGVVGPTCLPRDASNWRRPGSEKLAVRDLRSHTRLGRIRRQKRCGSD